MKRIGFLVATAAAFVIALAVPALASDGSSLGNRPEVHGAGGAAGGTAFTGANVSTGLLFLVAFIAIGALAVYAGRRRSSVTR
jgi:hypothetical protein